MPIAEAISAGASLLGLGNSIANAVSQSRARSRARQRMKDDTDAYEQKMQGIIDYNNDANRSLLQRQENAIADNNAGMDSLKYDFDKSNYDVNNYYDANRAQQVGATARQAQSSAALSGMGRSLGSAQGIASAVADKDSTLADKAYNRMQSDMNLDMNVADKNLSLAQNKLASRLNNATSLINLEKSMNDENYGNQADLASSLLSANLQRHSTI